MDLDFESSLQEYNFFIENEDVKKLFNYFSDNKETTLNFAFDNIKYLLDKLYEYIIDGKIKNDKSWHEVFYLFYSYLSFCVSKLIEVYKNTADSDFLELEKISKTFNMYFNLNQFLVALSKEYEENEFKDLIDSYNLINEKLDLCQNIDEKTIKHISERIDYLFGAKKIEFYPLETHAEKLIELLEENL